IEVLGHCSSFEEVKIRAMPPRPGWFPLGVGDSLGGAAPPSLTAFANSCEFSHRQGFLISARTGGTRGGGAHPPAPSHVVFCCSSPQGRTPPPLNHAVIP